MKQLVVEKNNPEPILWETPVPKPGPGEVLIQNHYSVVSTGTETATIESANKSVAKKIQNSSNICLLYTSPSPRDNGRSRMPSSA